MSSTEPKPKTDDNGESSTSKKDLSNYTKKHILSTLKENPFSINNNPLLFKGFRQASKGEIRDFVDAEAKLCQKRQNQLMKTQKNQRFMNLNRCAGNLIDDDETTITDNALPVTLEAISNLEKLPAPSEVNGIDLKMLYKILANLMAGYPINELEDGPTKVFLHQCYSEVMNGATSLDTKTLKDTLIKQDEQTQPVYSWLCNSDYSQYLDKLFKDHERNDL